MCASMAEPATHYLIIDHALENTVVDLLPECPIRPGRYTNTRHVFGGFIELRAAQWLIRDALNDRRTYLIRLPADAVIN